MPSFLEIFSIQKSNLRIILKMTNCYDKLIMYLKIKTLHCWCFGIELFHFKESGAFKITANIFAHPVYCYYNTCTLKSSLLGEKKKRLSPVRRTYIHTYTDFRKISRRRVYFPSPIFPHPSPCRHSHFPIW